MRGSVFPMSYDYLDKLLCFVTQMGKRKSCNQAEVWHELSDQLHMLGGSKFFSLLSSIKIFIFTFFIEHLI